MFGFGEKHTRGAFDDAQREAEAATRKADREGRTQRIPDVFAPGQYDLVETREARKELKAYKKIDDLMKAGHKEANKLNEKLDRLVKAAIDAREKHRDLVAVDGAFLELKEFEIDELGMTPDEASRSIEELTGTSWR